MSGTSRSRVTITLGGSGQVVNKDGRLKHHPFMESPLNVGRKRPVRERLGNNLDPSTEVNYKRLRGDGRTDNIVDDTHLRNDDLRFKIMQKNLLKQSRSSQPNGPDLRNILSRPAQSSTNSVTTRGRMPEPRDTRPRYSESMHSRQHLSDTRDGRHLLPMAQNRTPHAPEFRAPDPRRTILEGEDFGYRIPEQRSSIPITRTEPVISKYSPWTLDNLREKSPDGSLATSRGTVAPKRDEILQGKQAVGPYNDARTSPHIDKGALEISRPMRPSNLTKMAPSVGQMKTVAPVISSLPLPADDQLTVDGLLRSLGLEKYSILFKAEEVDMYSLKRMGESDLKELGIPMGPRKKILLSLHPRVRQQA